MDSYILFPASTFRPCPPRIRIGPSSIRYNSAKTTTLYGEKPNWTATNCCFGVSFAQFWLVSLVVETILGILPSSCLYGGGYHWLISLAFQGDISFQTAGTMRKLSVRYFSFLQECSRFMDLFLCPKDLLQHPFFDNKKLTLPPS